MESMQERFRQEFKEYRGFKCNLVYDSDANTYELIYDLGANLTDSLQTLSYEFELIRENICFTQSEALQLEIDLIDAQLKENVKSFINDLEDEEEKKETQAMYMTLFKKLKNFFLEEMNKLYVIENNRKKEEI